jgi:hypothetical protein
LSSSGKKLGDCFFFGHFELMFGIGWLIGKVAPMGREYWQEGIGAEDSKDRL